MIRQGSRIIVIIALTLAGHQAFARTFVPLASDEAAVKMSKKPLSENSMEQYLQRQISDERQKSASKNNVRGKKLKQKPAQKLEQKPAYKNPPYQVMIIAGFSDALSADLISPDQGIFRVKSGDRLTADEGRIFIVKAITLNNVTLVGGGKSFVLPIALGAYKGSPSKKPILKKKRSSRDRQTESTLKKRRALSGHIARPASAER